MIVHVTKPVIQTSPGAAFKKKKTEAGLTTPHQCLTSQGRTQDPPGAMPAWKSTDKREFSRESGTHGGHFGDIYKKQNGHFQRHHPNPHLHLAFQAMHCQSIITQILTIFSPEPLRVDKIILVKPS